MIYEAVIFVSVFIFLLTILHRKPSTLPPGEWGIPLIGYLPPKGERMEDTIRRLHAKHGKTFCAKIGARIFVYISDYETIKTTFGKHEFSGRMDFYSFNVLYFFKKIGIIFTSGITWDRNRKFALKVLKDFGMGKSKLEEHVKIEAEILVKDLREKCGKSTKIAGNLEVAVLNVIWTLVADKRFDHSDQEIHEFSELIDEASVGTGGPIKILDFYPWLIPFTPNFFRKLLKVDQIERLRDRLFVFLRKVIDEHRSTLDKNNIRDYIDMYLIQMENQEINNSHPNTERSLLDLSGSVFDLFTAGSDTTSTTIRWYFLYMAKYPEIQKKIQQEIDSVVPRERLPALEDKNKLSYFEATTYELLRKVYLAPFGLPHEATEDGLIEGYTIPKGTIIVSSIGICHHNEEYWERPNEFYPEHFLNEEGKFYIRKEGFLPFSSGRRQCLGELLAKMELFLFMGAILQNFTIKEPKGQNASFETVKGPNINKPLDFELVLTER